ncbi:MAG: S8 family serine peptidase [Xanthomonadaceae bacterium]|nr:S8 family serine peptidase [Xanthomonadaceae bacterium]
MLAATLKIGPLLKKEISQKQQNQLLKNHGVNESQKPASNEILTKVIVVMDANYLEPLAADLLRALQKKVEVLGGRLGRHAFNNVQVWIPCGKIQELALWPRIKFIKKPTKPKTNDAMGDSLWTLGAGDWQAGGVSGNGLKVGIIDAGFSGYDALLGSALPAQVVTKHYGSSFFSSKHGTACAEIVHAVAPEAALFLVNVDDIEVDFVNGVNWLQSQGVNVISSSIGLNLKIYCQQVYEKLKKLRGDNASTADASYIIGLLDQAKQQWNAAISAAVARGVVWSQAAGNDARKQWSGPFVDRDQDGLLNFSSLDNRNKIDVSGYVDEDVYVLLRWAGAAGNYNDYDLSIIDQNGEPVDQSGFTQAIFQVGVEECKFNVERGKEYYLEVSEYKHTTAYENDGNLVLLVGHEQFPKLQYSDPYGTVTLNCPASNPDVITVGAVKLSSSPASSVIENYSSQGPAGELIKPDLVAPDGLNTQSFSRFYGTSAAAPYVAGICALVRQSYPEFSPAQVKQYLESHALDLGVAGKDPVYGSGLVQLPPDFICQENNPAGCATPGSCIGIGGFWYGETCSLTPRREVRDYNQTIAEAPVRLGDYADDGRISTGEGLSIEVDFPLDGKTRNYALLTFDGNAYFIRNNDQGQFLTKEFTPVTNGEFFETQDLCTLLPGYQGTWELYFLSVPAEADDFQSLEALSGYLGSDAGQYVFGRYGITVDCR